MDLLDFLLKYGPLLSWMVFPAIWWAAVLTTKVDRLHKLSTAWQVHGSKIAVLEERTGGAIVLGNGNGVRRTTIDVSPSAMKLALIAALVLLAMLAVAGVAFGQVDELKERGSVAEYVQSVLASRALRQFGVLLAFGAAGVVANWFWKWVTDQITGSLWTYLVHDHFKRTLASACCIFAWALWAVEVERGWTDVINLALTTGFAIDALVNKATRAQWSAEERAAAAEKKPG